MRLPLVTKTILILVTVSSVCCELFRISALMSSVGKNGDGATDPDAPTARNLEAYYIILVLGRTPWWAAWTLVTTGFVETQIVPFLVFVVVAATGGRYCERVWSSRNYAEFVLTLLVGTMLLETILWGLFSSGPTVISGTNGLLAGIAVALKQLIPGHTIVFLRNKVRIQIKWLPLIFLITVAVLEIFGIEDNFFAYFLGFFGGWYYLRFHQAIEGVGVGDASDAFSFANFFPQPVAGWLEPHLDRVYNFLSSKLNIVKRMSAEEIAEGNQRYAARLSGTLLPKPNSGVRVTNERRRMMLRAMDKSL